MKAILLLLTAGLTANVFAADAEPRRIQPGQKMYCPNLWTVHQACRLTKGKGPGRIGVCSVPAGSQPTDRPLEYYVAHVNPAKGTIDPYRVDQHLATVGAANWTYQLPNQSKYSFSVITRPGPTGKLFRYKASGEKVLAAEYDCRRE